MKAPHLDQLVPMERGEAWILGQAVASLLTSTNLLPPVPAQQVLTLLPLQPLLRQLTHLHRREQAARLRPGRHPKPRQLRVPYDQLTALLHHRADLDGLDATEHLQLQGIIGKFQQKSLNLSQFIKFS